MTDGEVKPRRVGWLRNGNPAAYSPDLPKCGARKKSGGICQQVAMPNGRCYYHGGPSPGAPCGERNGNYKHGRCTKAYRQMMARAREARRALREIARAQDRAERAQFRELIAEAREFERYGGF